jgi:hypothetical protein
MRKAVREALNKDLRFKKMMAIATAAEMRKMAN